MALVENFSVPEGLMKLGLVHVQKADSPSALPSGPVGDAESERLFLDTALCFNRSVHLRAVQLFVSDVGPLHEGRIRWHVLHPIPSLSDSPNQWFRMSDAWPAHPPGGAPQDHFPTPGSYQMSLLPGRRLVFGDCIGWSLVGSGAGPWSFVDGGAVSWVKSMDGLHDAVELLVKGGVDPLSGVERPDPHIGWTGLLERSYSIRLLYELVEEAERPLPRPGPLGDASQSRAPIVEGGNPACWRGGFTFDQCCGRGNDGSCWDSFFTFDRCCTLTTVQRYAEFDFSVRQQHYDLHHLDRGNEPRLGPVQDDEALFLFALVRATRPRTIVEFGTSQGFSALNFLHAIADDPEARVFSYDILPYPVARALEDADTRFIFHQKSQADFDASDVGYRPVDVAFFDAGHLVEYSVMAFQRILPSLSPTALVMIHDTGLHVLDHGTGATAAEEGLPFTARSCARGPGGSARCHRFAGCQDTADEHGYCVGRAHRPSERQFVREVVRRWPEFRPLHVHSRRVFRHGLTLLQRGELWDGSVTNSAGDF